MFQNSFGNFLSNPCFRLNSFDLQFQEYKHQMFQVRDPQFV